MWQWYDNSSLNNSQNIHTFVMQLDVFIIDIHGALANKFLTFVGLLTSHRNFQKILNSGVIFILLYGFSDSLYTKFFFYELICFIFSPQIQWFKDQNNVMAWALRMTSAQNSISTQHIYRSWWRMKRLFKSFSLVISQWSNSWCSIIFLNGFFFTFHSCLLI